MVHMIYLGTPLPIQSHYFPMVFQAVCTFLEGFVNGLNFLRNQTKEEGSFVVTILD